MRNFSASIDVTPKMAHTLILALRELKIEHYVAPYEADAQLAYLWKTGYVEVVFTEDSDLLAFGVGICFFKMDNQGYGQEIDLENLKKVKSKPSFKDWTHEMLLVACILSGCDYLDSIKGIGFKSAVKLVSDAGNENTFLESMSILRDEGKVTIPSKYEKKFKKAFLTFKFQRVFCPKRQRMVHLEEVENNPHETWLKSFTKISWLGKELEDQQARDIAYGRIDPVTFETFPETANEMAIVFKAIKRKNPNKGPANIFSASNFGA